MNRLTRTKYFKGREPTLTDFEIFCKSHGLRQSEVVNDLIARFLKENERQQTLDAFPKREDPVTRVFELASLAAARSELTRILELVESNLENRHTFQLDMLRALKVAEPIYLRTRDVDLARLLQRAEVVPKGNPTNMG